MRSWHQFHVEIAMLILASGLGLGLFASCESSSPPPPPSPTASTEETEENSGSSDESALGSEEPLDGSDDSSEEEGGSEFDFGGAKIGDEDDQDAVKECHKKGKLYDRFDDEGGKCSDLALAAMDCTESGIKKLLSDKQKDDFDDKMSKSFDGWEIDQCADCPEDGDNELCESTSGSKQKGTKVFFVKEEGDEIKGKALVLPVHAKGTVKGSSADDGGEEDAASDEEEDESGEDDSSGE